MNRLPRAACLLLACSCTFTGITAHAVERQRVPGTLPSGACQPALPAYDGQIRKRPLAVQNESGDIAFVTCAWPAEGTSTTDTASLSLVNTSGVSATVRCTLVQGPTGGGLAITRSTTLAPNANGEILWSATHNNGFRLNPVIAASCALPAGVGVGYLYYRTTVDVGD